MSHDSEILALRLSLEVFSSCDVVPVAHYQLYSGILFTMKMRSQGKMELPIAKLMETSHAARAADPKLAAYLFAGRAFMTGTALTLSASLAVTMAVAAALDVNNVLLPSAQP
ncbi:hypothetical protein HDU99_006389 [Rhizoclosmatium hyalinum]|nr:hypothetical protein HDU99_006389 [Rhizoclosmatium hyalinum]